MQAKLEARYVQLGPIYHQVAVTFADLHDTPGRMVYKNCISKIVPWPKSRNFFYWRLKRRVYVEALRKRVQQADSELGFDQITEKIRRWFESGTGGLKYMWEDDQAVANWLQGEMDGNAFKRNSTLRGVVKSLQRDRQVRALRVALQTDPEYGQHALTCILDAASPAQLDRIQQLLDQYKRDAAAQDSDTH